MMNIYAAFDVVSNKMYELFQADSDGVALRNFLPPLASKKPRSDIQFYHVGTIDDQSMNIAPCKPRAIDMQHYHFDEVTAEHMNKTDYVRQIELYRKAGDLQLAQMQAELDKQLNGLDSAQAEKIRNRSTQFTDSVQK